MPQQNRKPGGLFSMAIHGDRRIAMFPAVAIGADMDAASEQFIDAFNPGKFVDHAGRHEQAPCLQRMAVIGHHGELGISPVNRAHLCCQHGYCLVPLQLAAGLFQQA